MLDEIDLKILNLLLRDAKMTYQEIGKSLFVSQGTVHVRVKKMIENGVIIGSKIIVDHQLLGIGVNAFIGIYLSKSSSYAQVIKHLKKISEVVEVHYVTGIYSILAKIACKDTMHLRDVLSEKVQAIKGIQRTETLISLDQCVNRPLSLFDEPSEEKDLT